MQDITHQNLEADLVNASLAQPVLLDIWAPWCGPCKTLGPTLEKLETAYGGRFKLVKLNADDEPEIAQQLSQMFGVRSIPVWVLFKGGRPVDGFVGALPESEVRKFLDKHVPSADEQAAEEDVQAAQELLDEGDTDTALDRLQAALATNPANDTARYDYLRALLSAGRVGEARAAFDPVATNPVLDARLVAAGHWIAALGEAGLEAVLRQRVDVGLVVPDGFALAAAGGGTAGPRRSLGRTTGRPAAGDEVVHRRRGLEHEQHLGLGRTKLQASAGAADLHVGVVL